MNEQRQIVPYCLAAKHSTSHYSAQDCMIYERDISLGRAEKAEADVETLREILKMWGLWWNGPGRENYAFFILPPITKTDEVLTATMSRGGA